MARSKSISQVLNLATYATQDPVQFELRPQISPDDRPAEPVVIPIGIVYRIYYLCRAFDGQAIKLIDPGASTRVDFYRIPLLLAELELVASVVSDPVTQHYISGLIELLKAGQKNPECSLVVSA